MCAIIGALLWRVTPVHLHEGNRIVNHIGNASFARGRDGWGYYVNEGFDQFQNKSIIRSKNWSNQAKIFSEENTQAAVTMIGNFRAEPTTEYVVNKRKHDQQPYGLNGWNVVHNGTIANDKELRTRSYPTNIDSAAIVEQLVAVGGGNVYDHDYARTVFQRVISKLKGSYAILATHDDFPDLILVACNYRPIWFIEQESGVFFASSHHYFPKEFIPQMIPPYSMWAFSPDRIDRLDKEPAKNRKALVICSGGMDSVVAATSVINDGYQVELVHFRYGSRAEGPEVTAIKTVAEHLGVPLHFIPMNIYDPKDSPLLRSDSTIAGGEAGAEFAHEWVPARNLVMLAIATAFAEAKGFDTIVLGNNLEEAGAYPDNEPEFIERFNDLLPFAVGDGKHIRVIMPVGNLMKHEIVALGHKLLAPLHLTWSCYRAGEIHCGTCGPCFMRRTAFEINGLPEVIQYASNSRGTE
jgi:7-cyano-7-deazaguanine synthase